MKLNQEILTAKLVEHFNMTEGSNFGHYFGEDISVYECYKFTLIEYKSNTFEVHNNILKNNTNLFPNKQSIITLDSFEELLGILKIF